MINSMTLGRGARSLLIFSLLLVAGAARAAGEDDMGEGMCRVVNLLTGKWLFGLSVLAMVAGGAALMFGAELTDAVKKLVTLVTIVGIILSFGGILSFAFQAMSSAGC